MKNNLKFSFFCALAISFMTLTACGEGNPAEDAMNKAGDAMEQAADGAKDAANSASEKMGQMADNAQDMAKDGVASLKDALGVTSGNVDQAIEKLKTAMGNADAAAQDKYQSLIDKLEGYKTQLSGMGENMTDGAMTKFNELKEEIGKTMEEVKSLLAE